MKKELQNSLRKDCFQRKTKDLVCRTFHKEMKTVCEALRKQELMGWEQRRKWYWEKFFLLIRTKFDIEIIHSADPYYFLVKQARAKAVKKADQPILKMLSKISVA